MWNGSSYIRLTEVGESPSMDLSQSALVWTVVSHKGHAWAPYFILYASELFKVVDKQLPKAHCYAYDTQIYLIFKHKSNTSQHREEQELDDPGQTPY